MILVTGATGTLGRILVLNLVKQGKKVVATFRTQSNLDDVIQTYNAYGEDGAGIYNAVQWVKVDFEDVDALQSILKNVTEVYHCAAKVSFDPKDKDELIKVNTEYTKKLLYACEGSSVEKFLFVSSIAVIDAKPGSEMIDEDCDFNPKEDHSYYAISKYMAEMEVWRAFAEGLKTIIINPGVIIGEGKTGSGKMIQQLKDNRYSCSGSTGFVDVRDVAKSAIQLMEKNAFGERFIIVSENKSYYDVANMVRKDFGKSTVKIVPKYVLKFTSVLNTLTFGMIPKLRTMTPSTIEALTSKVAYNNEKIIKTIDFEGIPIEKSISFHINCQKKK